MSEFKKPVTIPPGGITQLTGDVSAGPGSGSQPATLAPSGVTPGSYTSANVTVDSKGRVIAAANGSGGGITQLTGDITAGPGSGSQVGKLTLRSAAFSASGGTITPDATVATNYLITVDAAATIHGPTGGYNGQRVVFRLDQDNVGHAVTFSGGAGNFRFGSTISSFSPSAANKSDYVEAVWDAATSFWNIMEVTKGFGVPLVSLVQESNNQNNSGAVTTLAATMGIGTTGGNLLIASIGFNGSSLHTITSVVDNAGNTYTQAAGAAGSVTNGSWNAQTDVWYVASAIAGATVLTITWNSAPQGGVFANWQEATGASGGIDVTGNNSGGGAVIGPSLTPTASGDLIVCAAMEGQYVFTGVSSPWTVQHLSNNSGFGGAVNVNPPLSAQACHFLPANATSPFDFAASAVAFFAA